MNPIDYLSTLLGYIMTPCYDLTGNWWLAILLFTLITKIILLPISLWCQKNSIKMVQLTPEINRIKVKYFGDKDTIGEQQAALYKREHYHALLSIVPLAIQLIILIALIGTIYTITGANPELSIGLLPYETGGITLLMPVLAGFAAVCLSFAQNRIHPLQKEQTRAEQMSTNGVSVGISLLLGAFVPLGVGFYWVCSNIFSILVQVVCNWIINPKKYVDYEALVESKKELADISAVGKSNRKWYEKDPNAKREKADYKRFFSVANKHLVFYSEASGFYKYFRETIEYLLKHSNVIIHYVTNDPNDQIFALAESEPRIRAYYIGLKKMIPLMMKMDADIVVMTTPDLDNYYIKRSYVRKDVEYIFTDHGPTSSHMCYREGALDHFDTIFCVGPHQVSEIRRMEEVYTLPQKNLIECGYGQMDSLLRDYTQNPPAKNARKRILIAPSYQPDNILDSCIDQILAELLDHDYSIVVRPHPEYKKRFPAKMDALVEKYQGKYGENLIIESDFSSNVTIFSADLIITDWSGIAYEFSFTTKKPSLFINTPMKILNPNYEKIGIEPTDIFFRDLVGVSVDLDKLDTVSQKVEELFATQENYAEQITTVLEKYIFNLGESGRVGGKYILNLLQKRQKKE